MVERRFIISALLVFSVSLIASEAIAQITQANKQATDDFFKTYLQTNSPLTNYQMWQAEQRKGQQQRLLPNAQFPRPFQMFPKPLDPNLFPPRNLLKPTPSPLNQKPQPEPQEFAVPRAQPRSSGKKLQCIAGKPGNTWLQDQLDGALKKDNDFVNAWRSSKQLSEASSALCPECLQGQTFPNRMVMSLGKSSIENTLQDFGLDSPQRYIAKECVAKSFAFVPNTYADRFKCDSDNTPPSANDPSTPCMTDDFASYMQFAYNSAMKCLTQPTSRFDAKIAFRKINNESGFGGFLRNPNGIGGSQMTSIALREMMNATEKGAQFLIERMAKNPKDCQVLQPLMRFPALKGTCAGACYCRLTGVGNGIGRNALLGMGLFLYLREGAPDAVHKRFLRKGLTSLPEYDKIRDLFALVAFSAEGPAGANARIEQMAPYLKKMSYSDVDAILSGHPKDAKVCQTSAIPPCNGRFTVPYLRANYQKMRLALSPNLDLNCTQADP